MRIGQAARKFVTEKYDFHDVCLPEYVEYINSLLPDGAGIEMPTGG